jgi:hypothetical protein
LGWTTEGLELESRYGKKFSDLYIVQTVSGVHPTSYPLMYWVPGVKRQESEADGSPPTGVEVKKKWIYTSTPKYAFMT